jgi:hypothetical protein
MEFEQCRQQCIAKSQAEGCLEEVALFVTHPQPTDEEWAQCMREVIEAGEDINNPYHLMGRYELRLAKRGIKTGISLAAEDLKRELREIALAAGIPGEFVESACHLRLFLAAYDKGKKAH